MRPIILILLIALASCGPRRPGKVGPKGDTGNNGEDGYSLVVDVVAQTIGGVNCNRTDIFQDKDRNNFYSTGDTYQNGFLTCDGAIGTQGIQGVAGNDGADGQDGSDGLSSYQIALAHGFIGSEADYLNSLHGQDGAQGPQGLPGINADTTYQIVSIVDPCGPQHPQGFDEVILKLGNGTYLSSFSDNANGKNTRFGILPNGNYTTTDGTECHFSLPII